MPRPPTLTMSSTWARAWISAAIPMNAVVSAVFPGSTRTATGIPARVASIPYSICSTPRFLPVE